MIDPSLMINWRKNSWNAENVSSVFPDMCLCLLVCMRAINHTFWPRSMIFGLGHGKETFLNIFFHIFFMFTAFVGIFKTFSIYNISNFSFKGTGHSFSLRIVIFRFRVPCTIRNLILLNLIIYFLTVNPFTARGYNTHLPREYI